MCSSKLIDTCCEVYLYTYCANLLNTEHINSLTFKNFLDWVVPSVLDYFKSSFGIMMKSFSDNVLLVKIVQKYYSMENGSVHVMQLDEIKVCNIE